MKFMRHDYYTLPHAADDRYKLAGTASFGIGCDGDYPTVGVSPAHPGIRKWIRKVRILTRNT